MPNKALNVPDVLLKSQHRAVFSQIVGSHFDPADFEAIDIKSPSRRAWVTQILHKPTEGYVVFDKVWHGRQVLTRTTTFSPARSEHEETLPAREFEEQLIHVAIWLECLRREIDTPDVWAAFSGSVPTSEVGDPSSESDAEQLDSVTRHHLQTMLDEFKNEVLKAVKDSNSDLRAFVDSRVDQLQSAMDRVTKKDWKLMAWGLVANTLSQVALDPNTARSAVVLAGRALLTQIEAFGRRLPPTDFGSPPF